MALPCFHFLSPLVPSWGQKLADSYICFSHDCCGHLFCILKSAVLRGDCRSGSGAAPPAPAQLCRLRRGHPSPCRVLPLKPLSCTPESHCHWSSQQQNHLLQRKIYILVLINVLFKFLLQPAFVELFFFAWPWANFAYNMKINIVVLNLVSTFRQKKKIK